MIWYDVIWYDMTWYDMTWYDMIWHDMIWYDDLSVCVEARQEGISIVCGGVKPVDPALSNGYFIPPTVMVDVPTTRYPHQLYITPQISHLNEHTFINTLCVLIYAHLLSYITYTYNPTSPLSIPINTSTYRLLFSSSRVWQEEIFGPVLCLREFTTEAEAITPPHHYPTSQIYTPIYTSTYRLLFPIQPCMARRDIRPCLMSSWIHYWGRGHSRG